MKQLIITPKLCIDCKVCERACAMEHVDEFHNELTRIIIHPFEDIEINVPETCLQCIDPACAQVCPADAISINNTLGAVLIDYDRCVGCLSCVGGCPFGNMFHDPTDLGFVYKCDLCFGDPACARFCPTGALEYREFEPMAGKQQMVLEEEAKA